MPYAYQKFDVGVSRNSDRYWNRTAPLLRPPNNGRKKRRYVVPLDYLKEDYFSRDPVRPNQVGAGSTMILPLLQEMRSDAYAQAYDRFFSKIRQKAAVGLTILEREQSFKMIARRVGTLISVFRNISRGNLVGAARLLNGPRGRLSRETINRAYLKRKLGDIDGAYLEFIFGWKPLYEDVYNAVEVLQQDFYPIPVKGKGYVLAPYSDTVGGLPWATSIYEGFVHHKYQVVGVMEVTNSNLLLASQLGLVNPAQVAWEAIPFSFLVDQFLHINTFLGSLSNEVGMKVRGAAVTHYSHGTLVERRHEYGEEPSYFRIIQQGGFRVQRVVGSLPIPSLPSRFGLPKSNLAGRALSSVALLVQQLTNRK